MPGKRRADGWSPTGAARAARDCKAAAIDFLERSQIPPGLQARAMQFTYRAMLRMERDPAVAAAGVVTQTGVRCDAPPSTDWSAHARQVVARQVDVLRTAPLYVMAPSMCDVAVAAAQTLSRSDLTLLDETDPPTPDGLLLLPHTLVSDAGPGLGFLRGIAWTTNDAWRRTDTAGTDMDVPPGLLVSLYEDHRAYDTESMARMKSAARAEGCAVPPILLSSVYTMPFHAKPASAAEHDRLAAAVRSVAAEEDQEELGPDAAHATADYTPGSELPDPDHNIASRLTYAFFRLAAQRIAASEPAPVNHSAQVIAQRAHMTPDVRIVQLRATTKQAESDGGHHAVDWCHRWVVQMHKVRQWYPSQQQNKILLRGPYVKGPADKPLIGGEVVRALTR